MRAPVRELLQQCCWIQVPEVKVEATLGPKGPACSRLSLWNFFCSPDGIVQGLEMSSLVKLLSVGAHGPSGEC